MDQRMQEHDEEMAGGFLPEGMDVEEAPQASFFPVRHDSEEDDDDEGGGFVVEDGEKSGGFVVDEPKHEERTASPSSPKSPPPLISRPSLPLLKVEVENTQPPADLDERAVLGNGKRAPVRASPATRRRIATKPTKSHARSRGAIVMDSDDESLGELLDALSSPSSGEAEEGGEDDEDEDGEPYVPPPKPSRTPRATPRRRAVAQELAEETPPTRRMPARRSARKSTGTKSHYFEGSDDDE
jgi:xeroderma pigmentosum group C-complementing protein